MEYSLRRGALPAIAGVIGLGFQVLGIHFLGFALIASGLLLAVYFYGGGWLGLVTFPWLPWCKPRLSQVHKHGLTVRVTRGYETLDVTTPGWVGVYTGPDNDDVIMMAAAALGIEIRNTSNDAKRISDLYMEIRTVRFIHRLLDIIEPRDLDTDSKWYTRKDRKRVEWFLEPHSPAIVRAVDFEKGWPGGWRSGRLRFTLAVVLELDGGIEKIRLFLEDDVLKGPRPEQDRETT